MYITLARCHGGALLQTFETLLCQFSEREFFANVILMAVKYFLTQLNRFIVTFIVTLIHYLQEKMSNNKSTPLPAYSPGPPPMAAPPTYAQAVGGVPPTSPFTPVQTRMYIIGCNFCCSIKPVL